MKLWLPTSQYRNEMKILPREILLFEDDDTMKKARERVQRVREENERIKKQYETDKFLRDKMGVAGNLILPRELKDELDSKERAYKRNAENANHPPQGEIESSNSGFDINRQMVQAQYRRRRDIEESRKEREKIYAANNTTLARERNENQRRSFESGKKQEEKIKLERENAKFEREKYRPLPDINPEVAKVRTHESIVNNGVYPKDTKPKVDTSQKNDAPQNKKPEPFDPANIKNFNGDVTPSDIKNEKYIDYRKNRNNPLDNSLPYRFEAGGEKDTPRYPLIDGGSDVIKAREKLKGDLRLTNVVDNYRSRLNDSIRENPSFRIDENGNPVYRTPTGAEVTIRDGKPLDVRSPNQNTAESVFGVNRNREIPRLENRNGSTTSTPTQNEGMTPTPKTSNTPIWVRREDFGGKNTYYEAIIGPNKSKIIRSPSQIPENDTILVNGREVTVTPQIKNGFEATQRMREQNAQNQKTEAENLRRLKDEKLNYRQNDFLNKFNTSNISNNQSPKRVWEKRNKCYYTIDYDGKTRIVTSLSEIPVGDAISVRGQKVTVTDQMHKGFVATQNVRNQEVARRKTEAENLERLKNSKKQQGENEENEGGTGGSGGGTGGSNKTSEKTDSGIMAGFQRLGELAKEYPLTTGVLAAAGLMGTYYLYKKFRRRGKITRRDKEVAARIDAQATSNK